MRSVPVTRFSSRYIALVRFGLLRGFVSKTPSPVCLGGTAAYRRLTAGDGRHIQTEFIWVHTSWRLLLSAHPEDRLLTSDSF